MVFDVIENQLTADERRLVYDVFFSGKTQKEIAKEYGISESALSRKKASVIEKIKGIINK